MVDMNEKCLKCKHKSVCRMTANACKWFQEFDMHVENDSLHRLWDNPEDEHWNKYK
ncbi:MAG: hypothetical protein IMZ52_01675 [Actinobacteria bacterium]|nr:hypothetical protein [Actinomycetota bacterium]MBE3114808.1 hypothetical protein [Actinomycetota bacterium]